MNDIDKSDYTRDMREATPPSAPYHPPPAPLKKKPSRLVLFILAWLPGLGHMYLGLIRRGLFFLSAFAFSIFVTVQLSIMGGIATPFIVLAVFMIVATVALGFFESLAIRRNLTTGKETEDTIPAFIKNRKVQLALALIMIIPFIFNILSGMGWYIWIATSVIVAVVMLVRRK